MDLGARRNRLVYGIRHDLAVDGHRHTGSEVLTETREAPVQFGYQRTDSAGLDLDFLDPSAKALQRRSEEDPRHQAPLSPIAASTLIGDIGRSLIRRPVAPCMALATAAIGGTIPTSPTPRTP